MSKFILIAIFSFICSGCSNKQLYQSGQDYQKSKCTEKAISEQQHNDCINADKKTYQEYEKERKDSIKK